MSPRDMRYRRGPLHEAVWTTLKLGSVVLVLGVLVLWSWNAAAPALFAAEEIRYREALGLVLAGITAAFILRIAFSGRRNV